MAKLSNEQLSKQVGQINNRTQRLLDDVATLKGVVRELEENFKKLAVRVAEQRHLRAKSE